MDRHRSDEEIKKQLVEAARMVKVNGKYAHFKHPDESNYLVKELVIMENTGEVGVVYEQVITRIRWLRPIANFLEEVEWEGKMVKRFVI